MPKSRTIRAVGRALEVSEWTVLFSAARQLGLTSLPSSWLAELLPSADDIAALTAEDTSEVLAMVNHLVRARHHR